MESILSASVKTTIGGCERLMALDLHAMTLIQRHTGINLLRDTDALKELFGMDDLGHVHPSPGNLEIITWACLATEDEDLERSPENAIRLVGKWITLSNLGSVIEAVGKAVEKAMPSPEPPTNGKAEAGSARKNGHSTG